MKQKLIRLSQLQVLVKGGIGALAKPFDLAELRAVLARVMGGGPGHPTTP